MVTFAVFIFKLCTLYFQHFNWTDQQIRISPNDIHEVHSSNYILFAGPFVVTIRS